MAGLDGHPGLPRFRDVTSLIQKYYSYDRSTGERAGIYPWDSEESLAKHLESDLGESIQLLEIIGAPVFIYWQHRIAVSDEQRKFSAWIPDD